MATIPMGSQLYPGRGLNTTTGAVYGRALTFDSLEQNAGGGIDVQFTLESITSSKELTEKLSIAASASFTGAWGVSAEFSMSTSKQLNNYYTYALLRCRVMTPAKTLRNPQLTEAATILLRDNGWEAFATAYGFEYVEGFLLGGSYFALMEVQTSNEIEQQNVKAKLSGYYGAFKASAEFQSDMKEISKSSAINISVARTGGIGTPVEATLDAMIEEARNFPQTAIDHPVEIMALTAEYRHTVPLPAPAPANDLKRQLQRETLTDLGRAFLRLRDYKANLEFILQRPMSDFDDYRELEPAEVTAKKKEFQRSLDEVLAEIDAVVDQASTCAADFNQCKAYGMKVKFLELPRIQGELLNLKLLEEKLIAMEAILQSKGLLGGPNAEFGGACSVKGNLTVGTGGNARVVTRHIDGKLADSDGPDSLTLNWDNGKHVQVGGAQRSDLRVYGDVSAEGGDVRVGRAVCDVRGRAHIRCDERLYLLGREGVIVSAAHGGNGSLTTEGNIGSNGRHPYDGLPQGIAGGVHTWDVVAEGGIMVGPPGQVKAAMWNDGKIRGVEKRFVIDHPYVPTTSTSCTARSRDLSWPSTTEGKVFSTGRRSRSSFLTISNTWSDRRDVP